MLDTPNVCNLSETGRSLLRPPMAGLAEDQPVVGTKATVRFGSTAAGDERQLSTNSGHRTDPPLCRSAGTTKTANISRDLIGPVPEWEVL